MFYFLDSPATLMLLLVVTMVSGYALFSRPDLAEKLSFQPARLMKNGEFYRLGTAWLIHGGLGHLAFNLFTLYSFGRGLEAMLGSTAFLIIFFGSELAANALTLAFKGKSPTYASVGASGAISGVLFSYSLYRPTDAIYLFGALPMPAWLFALAFVGLSIFAMRKPGARGGIAHEAHLGGALGGVLLTLILDPAAFGSLLRMF